MGAEHIVIRRAQAEAGAAAPPSYPAPEPSQEAGRFAARLLWIFALAYLPNLVWHVAVMAIPPSEPFEPWPRWPSYVTVAAPLAAAVAALVLTRWSPRPRRTAIALVAVALAGAGLSVLTGQISLVLAVQLVVWAVVLRERSVVLGAGIAFAALAIPAIVFEASMMLGGVAFGLGTLSWVSAVAPPVALAVLAVLQRRVNREHARA
ncbi:hypothetical protein [Zhihengliuella halotolerans]|uniref:hypothetical protein n=1 Tax=Zhihengliuella halotolerans TaxID=370736 RepID=UPI000C801F1D|nr:hypothetical protein [Zhihengliuella halotolerans]